MLYRRFAVAIGAVMLGVAGFANPVGADQPEHLLQSFAVAQFHFADQPRVVVVVNYQQVWPGGTPVFPMSISIGDGTFGESILGEGQFIIDRSLSSASLTATIDAMKCDYSIFPPPCTPTTVSIDVRWTGEGEPINGPYGLAKHEDGCANVAHQITREAVATGTIRAEATGFTPPAQASGSGYFGRASFPQADATC